MTTTVKYEFSLILYFVVIPSIPWAKDEGRCPVGSDEDGVNCHVKGKNWQYDGVCVVRGGDARCHVPETRTFEFNLRVRLRQGVRARARPPKSIWIRGSGPGLDWSKPIKLRKTASGVGTWLTKIKYTYDSESTRCGSINNCAFNQRGLELRVYQDKDGGIEMLGPNLYVTLPVPGSLSGHDFFTVPDVDIFPWFHGDSLAIEEFQVEASELGTLHVTLIYPPSYDYNLEKRYPVMVILGHNVAIQIGPVLEFMYVHEASIDEAVVVVLHHDKTAPFCDFSPYREGGNMENVNLIWRCKREEDCRTCHRCWDPDETQNCTQDFFLSTAEKCLFPTKCSNNPNGEAWLDAIERKVMPKVSQMTKNRALTNFPVDRLTIVGFDGIGLLACHAAVTRSHVYQNAACFSPSLHWPLRSLTNPPKTNETGITVAMKNFSHNFMFYPEMFAFHNTQKYYLDYGEYDNRHFPFIDHEYYMDEFIQELHQMFDVPTESVLLFKNVPYGSNDYYNYPDGGTEVLNRIKIPLLFFFGSKGNPNIKFFNLEKLSTDKEEEKKGDGSKNENTAEKIPDECLLELQMAQRRHTILEEANVPVTMFLGVLGKTFFCV